MRTRRLFLLLTNVLLLTMLFLSIQRTYDAIPRGATYPVHYNAKGAPDRYGMKPASVWLFPGMSVFYIGLGIAVCTAVTAGLFPALARKHPKYVNVPEKETFLALPEETRTALMQVVGDYFYVLLILSLCLLAYLQWQLLEPDYKTSTLNAQDDIIVTVFGALGVSTTLIVVASVLFARDFKQRVLAGAKTQISEQDPRRAEPVGAEVGTDSGKGIETEEERAGAGQEVDSTTGGEPNTTTGAPSTTPRDRA